MSSQAVSLTALCSPCMCQACPAPLHFVCCVLWSLADAVHVRPSSSRPGHLHTHCSPERPLHLPGPHLCQVQG